MSQANEQLWINLFETCKKIRKLNPWEFWVEEDIITIEDPVSKQIGYCVIKEDVFEEEFSIKVLLGKEGLMAYLESLNYDFNFFEDSEDNNYLKNLFSQQGFSLVYTNREELFEEDYQQIKSVGMSFRGKLQCPLIRRLYPGSRPWLMEEEEDVRLLNVFLNRLLEILIAIDKQQIDYVEGCYLSSCVEDNEWKLTWIQQDDLVNEDNTFIYNNELKAHRIKKLPAQPVTLELHQFYLLQPVWDDELNRELYPLCTTFVNQENGLAYFVNVSKSTREEMEKMSEHVSEILLNELEGRPTSIIVSDDVLFDLVSDFCEKTNIDCDLGPTPAAEEFMNSFINNQNGSLENEERLLHLIAVAEQGYHLMLETEACHEMNKEEQAALKETWIHSVLFMYNEFDELPGQWTKESFEVLLQCEMLENCLKKKYNPYIKTSIEACLNAQQELGLFKNGFVLNQILMKYYN